MKLRSYLFFLSGIVIFMIIIRSVLLVPVESTWWMRTIELFFYLSPALLAWRIEKKGIKEFCRTYLFQSKNIDYKKVACYTLYTAILYPLLVVSFVFIGGNLLGIDAVGRVLQVNENFIYMGITFSGNSLWGNVLLFCMNILFMLGAGITLGTFSYIAEEVGWRGFLERNTPYNQSIKPVFSGLIWTLWGLPFYKIEIGYLFVLLLFNVIFSFYLSRVVRETNTIWASAAIRGIISFCSLSVINPGNNMGQLCTMVLAMLCLIGASVTLQYEKRKIS